MWWCVPSLPDPSSFLGGAAFLTLLAEVGVAFPSLSGWCCFPLSRLMCGAAFPLLSMELCCSLPLGGAAFHHLWEVLFLLFLHLLPLFFPLHFLLCGAACRLYFGCWVLLSSCSLLLGAAFPPASFSGVCFLLFGWCFCWFLLLLWVLVLLVLKNFWVAVPLSVLLFPRLSFCEWCCLASSFFG